MIHSYNSETEWLNAIRAKDNQALLVLYKQFFPPVLHFVLNNNGNHDDAKDVYQEAIIIFVDKVKTPDFYLNCKIKTYIFSVARFIWLKKLKKNTLYNGNIEDAEPFVNIDDEQNQWEEKEKMFLQMNEALAQLGEPCKSLIEDFYVHKKSMNDIAEKFGYSSADNAKNQKYKCLQRLKKIYFSKTNTKTYSDGRKILGTE